MDKLNDLVSKSARMAEELPLLHTSRYEFLASFIADQEIKPRRCEVFRENLIYLFYGRPAYRPSVGKFPDENLDVCPVCFVFKPGTVSKDTSRIFPCDSGAVHNDLFLPYISRGDLTHLELAPQIESARKLISLFFDSNDAYFHGRAKSSIGITPTGIVKKYHDLLLKTGSGKYDDRRSAIEVQSRLPISLKDQLLYVLLPRELLNEQKIRTAIFNDWRCDPIPYDTFIGDAPMSYYPLVREKLLQSYKASTRL